MKITCPSCGKVCKNQRGLAIHQGHMHKKHSEFELLKHEVQQLKSLVQQLLQKKDTPTKTTPQDMWLPIVPTGPLMKPELCTSYGTLHLDLMTELKTHFAQQVA